MVRHPIRTCHDWLGESWRLLSGSREISSPQAIVRLVGAVLAEQTDEWAEGRRYLGLDVMA